MKACHFSSQPNGSPSLLQDSLSRGWHQLAMKGINCIPRRQKARSLPSPMSLKCISSPFSCLDYMVTYMVSYAQLMKVLFKLLLLCLMHRLFYEITPPFLNTFLILIPEATCVMETAMTSFPGLPLLLTSVWLWVSHRTSPGLCFPVCKKSGRALRPLKT